MAKAKKKKELTPTQKIEIGVGLTAAAVAAAGAYFLYGSKDADKNRKAVKSWALKAKADVLEKLEDAKKMTREEYEEVVAGAMSAYSGVKSASKKEVKDFKSEMMDYWELIEKNAKPIAKKVATSVAAATAAEVARKSTKKAVKKAAKKSTKKAVKKSTKKAAKKTTKK